MPSVQTIQFIQLTSQYRRIERFYATRFRSHKVISVSTPPSNQPFVQLWNSAGRTLSW